MQTIKLKITPRAKQNKVTGWQGDILKVQISAPPVGGKANEELIKFLSKEWKVAKSEIVILKGEKSREKILQISDSIKIKQEKLI